MKIYSKSLFTQGVFFSVLGIVLLITLFYRFNLRNLILGIIICLIGFGLIQGSLSRTLSRENQIDEKDERNQLITFKTKSKSLQITQLISMILIIFLLIAGKIADNSLLVTLGMGIMIPFTVSLYSEIFCHTYYEMKC